MPTTSNINNKDNEDMDDIIKQTESFTLGYENEVFTFNYEGEEFISSSGNCPTCAFSGTEACEASQLVTSCIQHSIHWLKKEDKEELPVFTFNYEGNDYEAMNDSSHKGGCKACIFGAPEDFLDLGCNKAQVVLDCSQHNIHWVKKTPDATKDKTNSPYSLLDFKSDVNLFCDYSGQSKELSFKAIREQIDYTIEEVKEMKDAIEDNDLVEVLDGCIDTLFTSLGLLAKLKALGVDTEQALRKVAVDNLSKFTAMGSSEKEITIEFYKAKGIDARIESVKGTNLSVIRNANNKVMKPIGFVPTDLTEFVPKELRNDFI